MAWIDLDPNSITLEPHERGIPRLAFQSRSGGPSSFDLTPDVIARLRAALAEADAGGGEAV